MAAANPQGCNLGAFAASILKAAFAHKPWTPLLPMKIALGVSGGIAAYKSAEIVRLLQDRGIRVQVVMTRAAQEFVRPLTFAALSGEKVITDMFGHDDSQAMYRATDCLHDLHHGGNCGGIGAVGVEHHGDSHRTEERLSHRLQEGVSGRHVRSADEDRGVFQVFGAAREDATVDELTNVRLRDA